MTALSMDDLQTALQSLSNWAGDTTGIRATYRFKDFITAMAFMQACIDDIEGLNHHPEWFNVYSTVSVTLKTHDAGDVVTSKDTELAAILDRHATTFA